MFLIPALKRQRGRWTSVEFNQGKHGLKGEFQARDTEKPCLDKTKFIQILPYQKYLTPKHKHQFAQMQSAQFPTCPFEIPAESTAKKICTFTDYRISLLIEHEFSSITRVYAKRLNTLESLKFKGILKS